MSLGFSVSRPVIARQIGVFSDKPWKISRQPAGRRYNDPEDDLMKIHPERTFCCSLLGLSALVLACVLVILLLPDVAYG